MADEKITAGHVRGGAPCGATWEAARRIVSIFDLTLEKIWDLTHRR